eukprot:30875-Pelagococcus_subviridis.AAC.4
MHQLERDAGRLQAVRGEDHDGQDMHAPEPAVLVGREPQPAGRGAREREEDEPVELAHAFESEQVGVEGV